MIVSFADDDIIEATKKVCYSEGSVYLAPYYGNVTVLLYNKRLMEIAWENDSVLPSATLYSKLCALMPAAGSGFLPETAAA